MGGAVSWNHFPVELRKQPGYDRPYMKKQSLVRLATLSVLVLAAACSSNPNKAKDLDTKIDAQGGYQGQVIGLNDDKEVIIQKQTSTDAELRELNWKQYELEQKLASDHQLLTRCREEMADPRLGGSGNMTEIPEIDTMKTPTQVKEEMGITENGSLKMVRKEMYLDRLKTERDYLDALKGQHKMIERYKVSCEREMKIARVKQGLPADRYVGKGYYKDGVYIQTRRAEHNLDDAFSINSEETSKKTSSAGEQKADSKN